MNKSELISFVRRTLLQREAIADDQKKYHFQRVGQSVVYAFDTLLTQIPLDDNGRSKIESYYVKDYYNQDVKESNGYRYFGISDTILPIGEGRGIWYVQPSYNSGTPFQQSGRPETSFFTSLIGEAINDTVWRFGNLATTRQIVLENIGDSPYADVRAVDFGVIRSLDSYDDEENVVVPDGRTDLLVEMCSAWLAGVRVDNSNNNA